MASAFVVERGPKALSTLARQHQISKCPLMRSAGAAVAINRFYDTCNQASCDITKVGEFSLFTARNESTDTNSKASVSCYVRGDVPRIKSFV